jgi:hypothetical protein
MSEPTRWMVLGTIAIDCSKISAIQAVSENNAVYSFELVVEGNVLKAKASSEQVAELEKFIPISLANLAKANKRTSINISAEAIAAANRPR